MGGRLPTGLIGMVALVLAVEGVVTRLEPHLTTVWAADWKQTGQAAGGRARRAEILCFGDSLVKFGVLPRVVAAKSGRPAYNLALNAGPTPASFFLLRKALEAGARPKAVVVDFFPLMRPDRPREGLRNYPELIGLRDAFDLARAAREPDLLGMIVTARLLPTVKDRFEIRSAIAAALRGDRASIADALPAAWRTWNRNAGAQPMPRLRAQSPAEDAALIAALSPDSWALDRINAHYLRRFLDLADRRHVPVFWLLPPLDPDLHDRRERSGIDAVYRGLARSLQRRHPDLKIIDARHSGYNGTVHIDPLHLDRQGAFALSADLAAIIARHLDDPTTASRWVALPPYRERPIDLPLEDLGQARLAIQHAEARR
jgi:hypothetical protein